MCQLDYSPQILSQASIKVLLRRYFVDMIKALCWLSVGRLSKMINWLNQLEGLKSRADSCLEKKKSTWVFQSTFTDGLPYGFQPCLVNPHDRVGQFFALNLLTDIFYWFYFSDWSLTFTRRARFNKIFKKLKILKLLLLHLLRL